MYMCRNNHVDTCRHKYSNWELKFISHNIIKNGGMQCVPYINQPYLSSISMVYFFPVDLTMASSDSCK